MKKSWVKICPQCKSKNVDQRGMISSKAYSNNYVCLTCGFQSPMFPEISPEDAMKLPDKPKKFMPSRLPIFADKLKRTKSELNKDKIIAIISLIITTLLIVLLILSK